MPEFSSSGKGVGTVSKRPTIQSECCPKRAAFQSACRVGVLRGELAGTRMVDTSRAHVLFFFRPALERYSLPARQVVFFAVEEAYESGSRRLTAEHLTLGLVRQDSELVRRYVHGSSTQALIDDLHRFIGNSGTKSVGDLPLSDSAKAVLRAAEDLAAAHQSADVGPLHILGGALSAKTPVAEILISHGVTFADVAHALSPPDHP